MSTEGNVRVVHELNRLVNAGAMESIAALFAPDYVDHNPGWKVRDAAEFVALIRQAHADFGLRNTILDTIASGDRVAVRLRNEGHHNKDSFGIAATGRKTSVEIIEIYRLVDGRIAERWVQSDMLGFLSQIGAHYPFGTVDDASNANLATVGRILAAVNERDYAVLDQIMSPAFADHHPGLGDAVTSRDSYRAALEYMHERLQMRAAVDFSFSHEDKVITRVNLCGRHVGEFMGLAPTDREVHWTTIEIYRLEDGVIIERWAEDNLAGLLSQLGARLQP